MNDLVLLTQGDRHCVTVYAPVIPPQDWLGYQPFLQSLEAAMATANRRLTGRGVSQDIRRAIQQQFRQLTKRTGYEGLSVALFVTAESATGFLLPDRIEAAVRVADHFDLGPLLRAVTMAHHSYGVTLTEHDWGLWEATSAEPAQLLGGSSRDDAPGGDPRAMLFRLFRWVTAGSAYFLSRRAFVARALAGVRERLAVLDPQHEGLVVLFPDDDAFVGWRSDVVEEAGLGRPVEVVMGDADGLTPGRIGRELRRHGRRFVQQELSLRIARLRAEDAGGYPSTDLAEIAVAAAAGRVRTFVYDTTDEHYGRLDEMGRFTPDQWGYDALARIAIHVLAGGGEAYAVTPEEILAGTMDTPVLAEIAYPLPH